MSMTGYVVAIALSWAIWYASWLIAAAFTAATVKRAPSTIVAYVLEAPGFFFLLVATASGGLGAPVWQAVSHTDHQIYVLALPGVRLWQPSELIGWGLFALNLPGFIFAWWARLTLGRLWSGTITRKENHYIVDSGPYALVRHPIYTGLMASVVMTVAAKGTTLALLGGMMLIVGWTLKARFEERFLAAELGAAGYAAYRARVPMLVPFRARKVVSS
jgi:protein-S-isoprenylcysteine O-methyltransferase Ste14